jgi:hypothetical protein
MSDINDLPEVQQALHDMQALAACGLGQNEFGEWSGPACKITIYPSCGEFEVDIVLPNGGTLGFDVGSMAFSPARPPKKEGQP